MEKRAFMLPPVRRPDAPSKPTEARIIEERRLDRMDEAIELLKDNKPLPPALSQYIRAQFRRHKKKPENLSETERCKIAELRKLMYPPAPRVFAEAKEPEKPPLAEKEQKTDNYQFRLEQDPVVSKFPLDSWGVLPSDMPLKLREKYARHQRMKKRGPQDA
jgi:hypothetical protein